MNDFEKYYFEYENCAGGMASDLLEQIRRLPHYVSNTSTEIFKKVSEVTNSKPAPWPVGPIYDDDGRFTMGDENETPYDKWQNQYNQENFCSKGWFYDFSCNTWIVIDCSLGEAELLRIFGSDYESGTRKGLETLIRAALHHLDVLRWFIYTDVPDAEYFMFVCAEKYRDWIDQLKSP